MTEMSSSMICPRNECHTNYSFPITYRNWKVLGCGQRCSNFYMVGIFHQGMSGTCSPLIFLLCFSKTGLCYISLAFCTHYVSLANRELMTYSYLNFLNATMPCLYSFLILLYLLCSLPHIMAYLFPSSIRRSHVWKITNSEIWGKEFHYFSYKTEYEKIL